MDFMKTVDTWFLILAVTILGGYFLWSIKRIFDDFVGTMNELKALITKLFDRHDDHESRISALEGRCNAMHGTVGGRRTYDPHVDHESNR